MGASKRPRGGDCAQDNVSRQKRPASAANWIFQGQPREIIVNGPPITSEIYPPPTACPPLLPTYPEPEDEVICFGALYEARVAYRNQFGLDKSLFKNFCKSIGFLEGFPVFGRDDGTFALANTAGIAFAILDTSATTALHELRGLEHLKLQAVAHSLAGNLNATSTVIGVSINIYGPLRHYDRVGSALAKVKWYLQHPDIVDRGVRYDNPHYFKYPREPIDMQRLIKPLHGIKRTSSSVQSEVKKILDTLNVLQDDVNIPFTGKLLTPLLDHQKTGVKFIQRRENTGSLHPLRDLSDSGCPRFEPRSGSTNGHSDRFGPCLGGIIADTMGLGKTLTMLSSILLSLDEATNFMLSTEIYYEEEARVIPTKSTLVVVPSTQLMDVWVSEIDCHIAPNSLKISMFHGNDKKDDPREYLSSDMVITTYATLAADYQTSRVLHSLNWFRIVLDEAHWIRNYTTKQFRATHALRGNRRWCLTGTPIQNKLEDLGALTSFLKAYPSDTNANATFKKQIIDPLFSGVEDPFRNLRLLLQSLCLRRTRRAGPEITVDIQLRELTLSSSEKLAYDGILAEAKQEMETLVSTGSGNRRYTKLFTAIHRLRALCIQGVPHRKTNPFLSPVLMPEPVSMLQCEFCSSGEFLDLIEDETSVCPNCSRLLPESQGPVDAAGISLYPTPESMNHQFNASPQSPRELGTQGAELSTKLTALLKDLMAHIHTSKSIVFSTWTQTLDILSEKLRERQIPFVRIDGNVGRNERKIILADFQQQSYLPILLMTYGTGAVGLNLTAANRIHIIEPQWNPSVEEQAIGRAVRLGQAREVTVIKYVMSRTVEQNILEIQEKKRKLASFSLGDSQEEGIDTGIKELQFILFATR